MPLIVIFIFGLAVGSFLNVLIDRLPKNESVVFGRSYCDHCRRPLAWYDLLPLLSFLLLKGKCRNCKKSIAWQYPKVELITGLIFSYTYYYLTKINLINSDLIHLSFYLSVVSGFIIIFFSDLKYRIIPDEILVFQSVIALFYHFFTKGNIRLFFLSGLLLFIFFFLLVIITKGKGMGWGDVKMSFVMGLILGFPKIIIAFYLSFLTGALFSLILILAGKKSWKSKIAFGPFLALGSTVSLFLGDNLLKLIFTRFFRLL